LKWVLMNWYVFCYEFHMGDLKLLCNSTEFYLTTNYYVVVLIIM